MTTTVTCNECDMQFPEADPCGHITVLERGRAEADITKLVDEIRDVVEGMYGRPRGRRGVAVVLSQILCADYEPCWVAKVKFGSLIVAKCGPKPCGHYSPRAALEGVLDQAKRALGAES